MKKIISMLLAVTTAASMISCKGDGGMKLPLFGFGSTVEDNADSMRYMEYMYDNDNGKSINDQAMSGVTPSDELVGKVNAYLKAPVMEYLGQSNENPMSVNWWERMDINADGMAEYMVSDEGLAKLQSYIEGEESEQSKSIGGIAVPGPRKFVLEGLVVEMFNCFNDVSTIASGVTALADMFPVAVFFILAEMDKNNQLLDQIRDSIQTGFEQTNYRLDIIEQWLLSEDLRDVSLLVNSKMTDFSTLAGAGMLQQRRSEMNEFFGPNSDYQYHVDRAFDSALQRAACLKRRAASADYRMVPGNMLYSDIIFIRKLSELRLASSSVFLGGRDLVRFRGVKAQEDLKKVKLLKEAFLSDTTVGRDPNYYSDVMALLVSWEILLRSHIEVNAGMRIAAIDLEDAKHVVRGFGTFGDLDGDDTTGTCGKALTNAAGVMIAALFNYGDSMESVFDTGTSGDLERGASIRMVHKGQNLVSDLHLVPVMKNLLTRADMAVAPGKNEFFVDPALGRYILPRPAYWSRCESNDSLTSPELYVAGHEPAINRAGAVYADKGKFGSGWGKVADFADASHTVLRPFGDASAEFMRKGTISVWWKPVSENQCVNGLYLYITDKTYIRAHINADPFGPSNFVGIYCDSASASGSASSVLKNGGWNHIYVIWDNDGFDLDNSLHVKVFVNGELVAYTTDPVAGEPVMSVSVMSSKWVGIGYNIMDNLKIWNHVVSEDPAWEYNADADGAGQGRENALHVIYGADSETEYDYRPRVTGSNSGVGYYYRLP